MPSETLEFDLLARDSASKAFDALARSALKADAEIRAAFAEPVDVKVDSRGWDEYIGKVQAAKLANEDMIAKTGRLTMEAEAASRELDSLFAKLDPKAGGGGGGGLFSRLLGGLGGAGRMFGMAQGVGLGVPAAGLLAGAGVAGVGGLLSGAVGGLGAGGILGIDVAGAIKGYTDLQTKITSLQTSLQGMKAGSASYIRDQARLNQLLDEQSHKYGGLVSGMSALHGAFAEFQNKTRGPMEKLLGSVLTVAADALKRFAPVANAAAKALLPLVDEMDRWVKSPDFKRVLDYLATTGVHALAGFANFLGQSTGALMNLMVALSPVADAMGKLFSHLNGAGDLALIGTVLGGIAAAMTGVSLPVAAAIAGIVALGVAIDRAYTHSAKFRAVVSEAFAKVKASLSDLVTAAEGFWAKWGADIKRFGISYLVTSVRVIGDLLSGLAHLVAAVLDVLSGNWSGAWKQMKATASAVWAAIKTEVGAAVHAIGPIVSNGLHAMVSIAVSAWDSMNAACAAGAQAVVRWVASLPGRIVGAFTGLVGQMFDIGSHIIGGIISGLESKAGDLAGTLGNIATSIPSKLMGLLGINSPAKKTIPIGHAVVEGIALGIKQRRSHLENELHAVEKTITSLDDRIKAAQQFGAAFMGNPFSDVASTHTVTTKGGVMTQLINGQVVTTHAAGTTKTVPLSKHQLLESMLAFERKQDRTSETLKHEIKKLHHEGVSKAVIQMMESSGASGLAQIAALASATRHQVHEFNALNAQATKNFDNAGAYGLSGTSMKHLQRRKQNAEDIKHGIKEGLKGLSIRVTHSHMRVMG